MNLLSVDTVFRCGQCGAIVNLSSFKTQYDTSLRTNKVKCQRCESWNYLPYKLRD